MHAMSLYFGGITQPAYAGVSLAHYNCLSRACKFCTGANVLFIENMYMHACWQTRKLQFKAHSTSKRIFGDISGIGYS